MLATLAAVGEERYGGKCRVLVSLAAGSERRDEGKMSRVCRPSLPEARGLKESECRSRVACVLPLPP